MTVRSPIRDFQLANPLYKGSSVSFFTVANGVKTSTLATLYSSPIPTSTAQLGNPQKLNSQGQFKQPVYIDAQVVGVVSGISVAGHDTAIQSPSPTFRVQQSTGKLQYSYDGGVSWNDSGDYIFVARGAWATLTAYNRNDVVTQGGALYVCLTAHTSGTFATDLAASKWLLVLSFGAAAFTQNRIPYANAGGLLQDSANMTFDGTTFKLGVTKFTVDHATGNTVTLGTLGVSGLVTRTGAAATDTLGMSFAGTTTGSHYARLANTGGNTVIGTENSAGNTLVSGATAYASVFGNVSAKPVQLFTTNTVRVTVDAVGNVGVGVTPVTRDAGKGIEIGFPGAGVIGRSQTDVFLSSNYYVAVGPGDTFAGTGYAAYYRQAAGVHSWATSSASGTAGNAASMNTGMSLGPGPNLGVGIAPSSSATLSLPGSTTGIASLRIAVGAGTPSSPVSGDIWSDGTALYWRNNAGVTKTVAFV